MATFGIWIMEKGFCKTRDLKTEERNAFQTICKRSCDAII